MKIGLVTYQLASRWDIPTIIKNCVETGFEGVELRTTHAHKVEVSLSREERERFRTLVPELEKRFGDQLMIDNSAKDPHRFGKNKVWVRQDDGTLLPMTQASDFIAQLSRIDCFRVYAPRHRRDEVREAVRGLWET